MTNINLLVLTELDLQAHSHIVDNLKNIGKQAIVWGSGGGLSYLASKDKTEHIKSIKSIKHREKHNKALKKSILAGGLAGAIGASV